MFAGSDFHLINNSPISQVNSQEILNRPLPRGLNFPTHFTGSTVPLFLPSLWDFIALAIHDGRDFVLLTLRLFMCDKRLEVTLWTTVGSCF